MKDKEEIQSEMDLILDKAIINKNLRDAVLEIKKAVENDDLSLATELTGVKSYITSKMKLKLKPGEKYRFREDAEKNRKAMGKDVYCILDGWHHQLAMMTDTIPKGMQIWTSTGTKEKPGVTVHERGNSNQKHPIIQMMNKEHEEIRSGIDNKRKKNN